MKNCPAICFFLNGVGQIFTKTWAVNAQSKQIVIASKIQNKKLKIQSFKSQIQISAAAAAEFWILDFGSKWTMVASNIQNSEFGRRRGRI